MATQNKQNVSCSQSLQKQNKTASHNLSDDIVETILSYLPVKKAASLAIMSKRFRNSWRFSRDLSFDRDFSKNMSKDEFKRIVSKIIRNHQTSTVDRFRLYFDATSDIKLVCFWIHAVVRFGVKKFELDFTPTKRSFKLSYDLVDVNTLKVMKLVNCELHLPFNSNGMSHIRKITLQDVKVPQVTIRSVFSNCKSLTTMKLINCNSIYTLRVSGLDLNNFKMLVVKNCYDVQSIVIEAPSLCSFYYYGNICEFKFHSNLPNLNDVIMEIPHPRSYQLLPHMNDMVIKFQFVKILTVTSTFLEGLSARFEEFEYRDIEFWLRKLEEFHLFIASESYLSPSDVATFIKKCPRIERVFIDIAKNAFGNSLYWNMHGRKYLSECHTIFPFLKMVKIKGFTFNVMSVMMAKFFLMNARYLHYLVLVKAKIHGFSEFCTLESLRLGTSSSAIIEAYEYHNDKSTILPKHFN